MKKQFSLAISLLFLVSITAAAPLQVEVQKLFGAEVGETTDVTVQNKTIQPKQSNPFSIFSSSGDDIIEPGDDLTGELELTIDCGSADVCYADYWLQVDGTNYFAEGNTYYASDGETITVKVDLQAPDSTGVHLGYWYQGTEYNVEDGYTIDTEGFVVAEDSDGDGVADSSDDCPDTPGEKLYDGCPPPDFDDDGVPDDEDECPSTGDQGFGLKDNGCPIEDSDSDGIPDPDDDCPQTEGSETADGCPDSDGDGVPDSEDEFPNDPDCVEDSDGDGVCDSNDAFPNDPSCTEDTDNDGVCDSEDQFPNDPECVEDSDGDGVCDAKDAFPNDPLKTSDTDGDGIADSNDNCPDTEGLEQFNGCPDSDSDGVPDNEDECPATDETTVDENGCPVQDKDETENRTEEPGDGSESGDGDGQIGNSFDRQVFQALQNLYDSVLTIFS